MRLWRPRPTAEFLQWFGLGGAALTWAAQLVIGFGTTVARCSRGSVGFGIDLLTWELTLMLCALALALTAEGAAVTIVARTGGLSYDDPPPDGRRHFFALAAAVGNLLFVGAILLSGVAALSHDACRQG
jgi:hypothetical protein